MHDDGLVGDDARRRGFAADRRLRSTALAVPCSTTRTCLARPALAHEPSRPARPARRLEVPSRRRPRLLFDLSADVASVPPRSGTGAAAAMLTGGKRGTRRFRRFRRRDGHSATAAAYMPHLNSATVGVRVRSAARAVRRATARDLVGQAACRCLTPALLESGLPQTRYAPRRCAQTAAASRPLRAKARCPASCAARRYPARRGLTRGPFSNRSVADLCRTAVFRRRGPRLAVAWRRRAAKCAAAALSQQRFHSARCSCLSAATKELSDILQRPPFTEQRRESGSRREPTAEVAPLGPRPRSFAPRPRLLRSAFRPSLRVHRDFLTATKPRRRHSLRRSVTLLPPEAATLAHCASASIRSIRRSSP